MPTVIETAGHYMYIYLSVHSDQVANNIKQSFLHFLSLVILIWYLEHNDNLELRSNQRWLKLILLLCLFAPLPLPPFFHPISEKNLMIQIFCYGGNKLNRWSNVIVIRDLSRILEFWQNSSGRLIVKQEMKPWVFRLGATRSNPINVASINASFIDLVSYSWKRPLLSCVA